MKNNSLQAALEKIKADTEKEIEKDQSNTIIVKKYSTVLIGTHFHPKVQKQLRILAAEESKTHHILLSEALDLLFV